MRVCMVASQRLQEAGAERALDRGQVYDLSAVVAASLVASGFAHPVDPAMRRETKPAFAPERKRARS